MKIFVALSAVPLSLARPFMKNFSTNWYAPTFKKYGSGKKSVKYRIYLPLGAEDLNQAKVVTPLPEVQSAVEGSGYEIVDYLSGIAAKGERKIKIGKLLKDKEVLNKFANDPQRTLAKQSNHLVVISRHPYDIIGASFDRGWTSCMDVEDGEKNSYLVKDIKQGTLVAYLINTDDKNINAPISRIFIKRYTRGLVRDRAAVPGRVYGTKSARFEKTVKDFCDELNIGVPAGLYSCPGELYHDGITSALIKADSLDEDGLSEIIYAETYSLIIQLNEEQIIKLLKLPNANVRGVVQQLNSKYQGKEVDLELAQYLADTSPKIFSDYIDVLKIPVDAFVKLLTYCDSGELLHADLDQSDVDKIVDYAAAQDDTYVIECAIILARTSKQLLKLANGRDKERLQLAMGLKAEIPAALVTESNSHAVLANAKNKKALEAAIKLHPSGELMATVRMATTNRHVLSSIKYALLDRFPIEDLAQYNNKAMANYIRIRSAK